MNDRFDIGVTTIVPISSYEATSRSAQVTENGATIKSDTNPFIIPAVGFVVPVTEEVKFGFGIYSTSGAGVDYRSNLYNAVTYTYYTNTKIAPAFSYSFGDLASIGIAPTLNVASFAFEVAGNPAHSNAIAYGGGLTAGVLINPLELFEEEDLPSCISQDFLSVGFAYESKQWFTRFEYNTSGGKDKLEFDLPQTFTVGLGLRPTKKLRLGFDAAWIDWSSVLGNDLPAYAANASGSSAFNSNWNNQIVYKVGGELDVLEDSIVKKLTLRLGYNYGAAPISKDRPFENIALPGIAEHHLTCGAGVKFTEKLGLNAAFMYSPKNSVDSSNLGAYIDDAKSRLSQYSVDVAITYEF